MPRGKRKPALQKVEELIAGIDAEIEVHKDKISILQTQRKELLDQKKKLQLEALYSRIQESGKSMDEILNLVKA